MREVLPGCVAEALLGLSYSDRLELINQWLEADDDSRADIEAFFASGGAERVRELQRREES